MTDRYKPLFSDESREKCPYVGCGSPLFNEDGTYHCRGCNSYFYLEDKTLKENYNDE